MINKLVIRYGVWYLSRVPNRSTFYALTQIIIKAFLLFYVGVDVINVYLRILIETITSFVIFLISPM